MILRLTYLTLLLAGFTTPVAAQTFRASALAGANLSQIDGDELQGFHEFGANAGLRVVAVINDRWRFGPEILYSQQGAYRPQNSINESDFQQFQLTTLEVPLMAYYKDWRFTAEAGFSFQRLFSYFVTDRGGEDITENVLLKDNLFAFKTGVTFHATENWGVNFRWSKHISDINVGDINIDGRLTDTLRGRTISLRLVYTFGAGEALPAKPQDRDPNN